MPSVKPKKKTPKYNLIKIFLTIFMGFFILTGTILAFYYAKGYRFNIEDNSVSKTGVISAESEPSRANLYIDTILIGKTPKSANSIDEGNAQVSVWKEGYKTWQKNVPVLFEKSTPLYPYLVLEKPIKKEIFNTQEELISEQYTEDGNHIFFITRVLDASNTTGNYKIWKYDINSYFWELTDNPKVVYEAEYTNLIYIALEISPDSKLALLKTTTSGIDFDETTKIELLHTTPNGEIVEDLDNNSFINDYSFTWANNSKYIVMENKEELVSQKISDKTKYILHKKNDDDFIWTTDTLGFMYFIDQNPAELSHSLSQTLLDGTQEKIIIDHIYSGTDLQLIKSSRENNEINHTSFTNAPENKMFVGKINGININQEAQGVIFSTTEAMYWYNIEDEKYITINNYPSEVLSFSEEDTLLLIKDTNQRIGIFTREKEESDHITMVGTIFLEEMVTTEEKWLSNELNFTYLLNNTVYISDIDGTNNIKVQELPSTNYQTSTNRKYMYTTKTSDTSFSIIEYEIN